ncbi:uncharacterized protein EI90DRAFT_1018729 [Cantharellus anzutake]|uniref:uncharacterized protein n=1 Tax=Cantharellus anzutake TaxID=1750568 RepID=UPI00190888B3|nr:uncharacterized protein EI90DRAFT_1018729 [Cantharellus anzutake]KAF8331400.1 hypothetical protein EI90DRAFT_1018729 [Cantharellus anzutake]
MLGVERGFVDDSGSFSQPNETSFVEESIDQSADASTTEDRDHPRYSVMTDSSIGEVIGAQRGVFTQAQSTQSKHPEIMPPSPLPQSNFVMQTPSISQSNQTPSTTGTETEDDEPATPSTRGMSSPVPPAVALPDQVESIEHLSPAPRPDSRAKLNLDAKPLPATPQPRLSLDLSISSSFHESEFSHLVPLSTNVGSHPVTSILPTSPAPSGNNAHEDASPAVREQRDPLEPIFSERPQRRRSRSTGDAPDSRGGEVRFRHTLNFSASDSLLSQRAVADRKGAGALVTHSLSQVSAGTIPLSASISEELKKMYGGKHVGVL